MLYQFVFFWLCMKDINLVLLFDDSRSVCLPFVDDMTMSFQTVQSHRESLQIVCLVRHKE